jgi:hypothetical protein
MGIFASRKPSRQFTGPPGDPGWVRNPKGLFYKFALFEPEKAGLKGVGGVYVVWHSGVKPRWVYVGRTDNLAGDLDTLLDNEEVMDYNKHGGLYVTWSPIKPEFREGVYKFLREAMNPEVENPDVPGDKAEPIPVLVPGAKAG